MTIGGTNFGSGGPTSLVMLGYNEDGITINIWNDTQIVVYIDDPASDGVVKVFNDFTPSNNNNFFEITSPNYTFHLDRAKKTVVKGTKVTYPIRVEFKRGFSTSGINFSFDSNVTDPAIISASSIYNQGLKNDGCIVLEINTASLSPGVYPIRVIADDGVLATRSTGEVFFLEVVNVGDIKFFFSDSGEITNATININVNQGEIYFWTEAYDTSGRTIQPQNFYGFEDTVTLTSSNPDVLLIHKTFWGYQFFANNDGIATITDQTQDGYAENLFVNVTINGSYKVLSLDLNPTTINNDPNGTTGQEISFFATYNTYDYISWGIMGMWFVDIDGVNPCFGCSPVSATGSLYVKGSWDDKYQVTMPMDIGKFIVYAASYDNLGQARTMAKEITVQNTPGYASVGGKVFNFDSAFMEIFYLEFYDADNNLVLPRLAEAFHGSPFTVGLISPGNYKIKFETMGVAKNYWYPYAESFQDAQLVTLVADQKYDLPYVMAFDSYGGAELAITPVVGSYGDKTVGSTTDITFTLKSIGQDVLEITAVEKFGDDAFSIQAENCMQNSPLAYNQTCHITVRFSPQSTGQKNGYIKISGANPQAGEFVDIPLHGNGNISAGSGEITINNGDTFTNTRNVTLTLTCLDPLGCSQVCLSNDTPTCTSFVAFTTSKAWTLSTSDGEKTVYAKFKNTNNQVGSSYYDTIILDSTAPIAGNLIATPSDGQVQLNWSGFSDTGSGLKIMPSFLELLCLQAVQVLH